jgi:hypothetical protein
MGIFDPMDEFFMYSEVTKEKKGDGFFGDFDEDDDESEEDW